MDGEGPHPRRGEGHLKVRWHCLFMKLPVREKNINYVVCSCVILHNICEELGHQVELEEGGSHCVLISESEELQDKNMQCKRCSH